MAPIPVLVLTGFLGSGKTTLINRILSEQHGRRLAVIENEFGEVGVDNDLVLGADEEIFEMNNGCLCCTVRGDLIRILGNLARRKNPVDLVVVETTGLADPGPVAQTFFMDDEIRERYRLMGIVTVVDALHCGPHLDQSPEAARQVAFADLLLVNKVDLVSPVDLESLKARLRSINSVAPQIDTQMAALELNRIWDLAGFSLERALGLDAAFLEVERPFESALPLPADRRLELRWKTGPDPRALALVQTGAEPRVDEADAVFQGLAAPFAGPSLGVGLLTSLDLQAEGSLKVELPAGERGWLFFEHHPDEFGLELWADDQVQTWDGARFYRPNHKHDDVTSVGLTSRRPLDPAKFQLWLSGLLAVQGADLYRSKGILYLKGSGLKQVFQGVHMLLTGGDLGPWGDQVPETRMVFIGRNLDRQALTAGFERCLA